ncbi:unnamed protein product [Pleuronectes platessa]|uniref:Uncharacterized protein n=1 Tax=Pleuronectes platessa TaxID=8262 RepID=A0A9N7VI92_PLEPL|nr:unnamed protein product [Pleuronectes platessa]
MTARRRTAYLPERYQREVGRRGNQNKRRPRRRIMGKKNSLNTGQSVTPFFLRPEFDACWVKQSAGGISPLAAPTESLPVSGHQLTLHLKGHYLFHLLGRLLSV